MQFRCWRFNLIMGMLLLILQFIFGIVGFILSYTYVVEDSFKTGYEFGLLVGNIKSFTINFCNPFREYEKMDYEYSKLTGEKLNGEKVEWPINPLSSK